MSVDAGPNLTLSGGNLMDLSGISKTTTYELGVAGITTSSAPVGFKNLLAQIMEPCPPNTELSATAGLPTTPRGRIGAELGYTWGTTITAPVTIQGVAQDLAKAYQEFTNATPGCNLGGLNLCM